MRVPIKELKKYLLTDAIVSDISNTLVDIGFEVEEVVDYRSLYNNFIIGKIKSVEKYPSADKLNICMVDIGNNCIKQIVCGAKNVRPDLFVVVSLEGALIPRDNFIIKKKIIKGVESDGMICSESELLLSNESDGIMELCGDYVTGMTFSEAFFNDDTVLVLNITPNRGDCNGIIGIARELCAAGLGSIKKDSIDIKSVFDFDIKIKNNVADVFGAVCLYDIKNISSPDEIKARVLKFGINSYNLVVDISNLVMMETGNPVHIYDRDKISDNIVVDIVQNDKFIDFFGSEKIVDGLCVNDSDGIISIFGISGSKRSSIDMSTRNIVVEVANIDYNFFIEKNKNIDIKTEARYRFERGTDPDNITYALQLVASYINYYCGGKISQIYKNVLRKAEDRIIFYNIDDYKKTIGNDVDKNVVIDILQKLSFVVRDCGNELELVVPKHRYDVQISRDITEEIVRIVGLNAIEPRYSLPFVSCENNDFYDNIFNIKQKIVNFGLTEVINFSFVDSINVEKFGNGIHNDFVLLNPVSSKMNYMRPTLLIGLLENIKQNIDKNKIEDIMIFEDGVIFGANIQERVIAGVMIGNAVADDYFKEARIFDIFDVKRIVEMFASGSIIRNSLPFFHPYRSFSIVGYDNKIFANYGEIHPRVLSDFGIKNSVVFFELFVERLVVNVDDYRELILHPIVKDMSFIVDNDIFVGNMITEMYLANDQILNIAVYDVYSSDEKIGLDKKSVTFRIKIYQKTELSSEDINRHMISIKDILVDKFDAVLRGEL